jgi:hypothetical protein
MSYNNGNSYKGDYQNDLKHGDGTFIWADNGAVYKGSWFEGKTHGLGHEKKANGD